MAVLAFNGVEPSPEPALALNQYFKQKGSTTRGKLEKALKIKIVLVSFPGLLILDFKSIFSSNFEHKRICGTLVLEAKKIIPVILIVNMASEVGRSRLGIGNGIGIDKQ